MEFTTLNNGVKMPMEGFGAMMIAPEEAGKRRVSLQTLN